MRSSSQGFLNIFSLMCGDVERCPGPGCPRKGISEMSKVMCCKRNEDALLECEGPACRSFTCVGIASKLSGH